MYSLLKPSGYIITMFTISHPFLVLFNVLQRNPKWQSCAKVRFIRIYMYIKKKIELSSQLHQLKLLWNSNLGNLEWHGRSSIFYWLYTHSCLQKTLNCNQPKDLRSLGSFNKIYVYLSKHTDVQQRSWMANHLNPLNHRRIFGITRSACW